MLVGLRHPLCPLRSHLHSIGRPGKDEKKRASPDYENENGHADVQRDPSWRTDVAKVAAGSSREAEPECPHIFWLGTTCTERPLGRPPGPVAALGVFPTLPGPDIVEPEAAVATAPAAFAKAVGLVVFGAKFDAETEDCFTLFAEIKGDSLESGLRSTRGVR